MDREYIAQAGLLLDLRIVLCTVLHLAACSGDYCRALTGLRREASLAGGCTGNRVNLDKQ